MNKSVSNSNHTITSQWDLADYLGAFKVRSAIGRGDYIIEPGIYKLGNPDSRSDVFVTSNYKLSFDILRKNLGGMNAWILVLDTKGINVWCAAGKGTFGTGELIRQIKETNLNEIISHRRLILPQLGAPGIQAYTIKEETGFKVKYGPVNASDIKPFIESGYKATESMRTVAFGIKDRFILTPVEIVNSLKPLLIILFVFIILSGLTKSGISIEAVREHGLKSAIYIITAYISGAFLTPILLPWLPFRYFAGKGLLMSLITFSLLVIIGFTGNQVFQIIGWLMLSVSISSFLAMNFTGATTYTSLSGVKKEMKLFVPIQVGFTVIGLSMIIISKFLFL